MKEAIPYITSQCVFASEYYLCYKNYINGSISLSLCLHPFHNMNRRLIATISDVILLTFFLNGKIKLNWEFFFPNFCHFVSLLFKLSYTFDLPETCCPWCCRSSQVLPKPFVRYTIPWVPWGNGRKGKWQNVFKDTELSDYTLQLRSLPWPFDERVYKERMQRRCQAATAEWKRQTRKKSSGEIQRE